MDAMVVRAVRRDTAANRPGAPLDTIKAADPVIETLKSQCWRLAEID